MMRFAGTCWTEAITDRIPRDIKGTPTRWWTYWYDLLFFVKAQNERHDAIRGNRTRSTLVRDRDEWRRFWRSLTQLDDQRYNT
ncbi:unnamed protein product [Heligmosomoides polygyrus]|uniref:Transposase n=1 Tax=Heligmosomoides polygyrus TaxID=6339 RepID=A0A183F693_HELPZ|nr:unnamed protein product [Heligmosomoides polygyrus]